jgi:hypothetical protein
MERHDGEQRPTLGAFLRTYRDYYREKRGARLQLASVCCLVLAGAVRSGPVSTVKVLGLTLLVVAPIAYALWRWKQRKRV